MERTPRYVKVQMPTFQELLDGLPVEMKTEAVCAALREAYKNEVCLLLMYALQPECAQPFILMSDWRQASTQWIVEFSVQDEALPWKAGLLRRQPLPVELWSANQKE